MSNRLQRVDLCKGIAILLAVIGHVVSSFHNTGKYIDTAFFNYVGVVIYSFICHFFVISGFLASRKTKSESKMKQIKIADFCFFRLVILNN